MPLSRFSQTRTRDSPLPASVSVGQTFSFQIAGKLTIRRVTRPETFTTHA